MCREVVATQTAWPAKPETSTIWPFTEVTSPALGQGSAFLILQITLPITCQLQPVLAPHPAQTCQPCCSFRPVTALVGPQAWLVDFSPLPRRGTREVRLRKSPQTQRMSEWLPPSPSSSALCRRQPGGPAAHCGTGRAPLTAPTGDAGSLYQLLGGWEYKRRPSLCFHLPCSGTEC